MLQLFTRTLQQAQEASSLSLSKGAGYLPWRYLPRLKLVANKN